MPTKPGSEAHTKRMARWQLFGYVGSCRWIITKMAVIRDSPYASETTRRLATELSISAEALGLSLTKDIKGMK